MPRSRNIKPGFFKNDLLVELSFETRFLFIGLWTLADKAGRLEDRPKRIKMEIFPADEVNVDKCLAELAAGDDPFLIRYSVDGKKVIQIVNWGRHQRPHHQETESDLPEYVPISEPVRTKARSRSDEQPNRHRTDTEPIALIPDSFNLIPDSGLLIPDSPNPDSSQHAAAFDVQDVFSHYKSFHPKAKLGEKQKKLIQQRHKEGFSAEELKRAIDGNHLSPHHNGQNEQQREYHRLDLIFRDSDKVTDFIEIADRPRMPVLNAKNQRNAQALANFLERRSQE